MSEDRVLEMRDEGGEWLPVGTIKDATIEWDRDVSRPLDYFHVGTADGTVGHIDYARSGRPAVVVIGATDSQRELIASLAPEVVITFFDEFTGTDVKSLYIMGTQLVRELKVEDQSHKELAEMFDRLAECPPLKQFDMLDSLAVENLDFRGLGKRCKKGKFKKDWQR